MTFIDDPWPTDERSEGDMGVELRLQSFETLVNHDPQGWDDV
jgi:hypothetical protein